MTKIKTIGLNPIDISNDLSGDTDADISTLGV